MFTTVHHRVNRSAKNNHQADHTVKAGPPADHTVEADQLADHTAEAGQPADHTVEADQSADCTVEADQQAIRPANDRSGEELRLRFTKLHLQHMDFLETEMRFMRPFQTLLLEDWEKARSSEGSDTFVRNSPYERVNDVQHRIRDFSDNFLKSSAAARPFIL
jgi:hypothetical protein